MVDLVKTPVMRRVFELHGIPYASPDSVSGDLSNRRKWIALVHGLDVPLLLANEPAALLSPVVRPSVKTRWQLYLPDRRSASVLKKAERIAIRAAYALGISACAVGMEADIQGRPAVTSVKRMTSAALRGVLKKYGMVPEQDEGGENGGAPAEPLLMGADIELLLTDAEGKVIPAERYLPRSGPAGCDMARWDGQARYPLMELRPEPAKEPAGLLRALYRTMQLAAKRIGGENLAWRSGGLPHADLPLGGHLHFSGVPLTVRLLRTLDNYVALPVLMLEDAESVRRRPRFGFLGDFRRKSHGGFEYRTLPSWLFSPQDALGILSLAYLAVTNADRLNQRPLHSLKVQEQFYAGDKEALRPWVSLLWSELERLPLYETYREELDRLKRRVMTGETWNSAGDIRQAWQIGKVRSRDGDAPRKDKNVKQIML